ncbi:hypothetical protein [Streptomyces sp. NPDC001450]
MGAEADEDHSDVIAQPFLQFNSAGFPLAGFGMGFRAAHKDGRTQALNRRAARSDTARP